MRSICILTIILGLVSQSPGQSGSLLPADKLIPFTAKFEGEKIVSGNGPRYPWRVSKWQKDAAGFVSFGPLEGGGDGITIWSDAKYGPNFWIDLLPISAGVYRLTFDARSIGTAPWRLIHRVTDLPDPTLSTLEAPAGATVVDDSKGMRTLKFEPASEWRSLSVTWTISAEKAKYNLDFGLLAPGGESSPLLLRNIKVEKIGEVDSATVAERVREAMEKRRSAQLRDFYGTVRGSVVAADSEKVVLSVERVYPYTKLDSPESLVKQNLTIHVTPAQFSGNEREVRNQLATTPPRKVASAYFASLRSGQVAEFGVYGDLSSGEAKLSRLPGPTSLPPDAPLPSYFGADIDEKSVTTHLFVSSAKGNDSNNGKSQHAPFATIEKALAAARVILDQGTPVKIQVAAGVYRPASTLRLADYEDRNQSRLTPLSEKAREATLIVEGEKPDSVFIRGSITAGFEPSTWTLVDPVKRIYRHDWTHNFGTRSEGYYKAAVKNVLLHRRELLAVNGTLLKQVLLEDYDWVDPSGTKFEEQAGLMTGTGAKVEGKSGYIYKGFRDPVATLKPGEFGVAEKDPGQADHNSPNTIFLRLPEGIDRLDNALVEVGMLQTILRLQDKSNIVLRNLTFEHSTSWWNAYYEKSAIDTNTWGGFASSHDWLIENVTIRNNRSSGLALWWVRNATIRNCNFVDNGHLGFRPSFVNEMVTEDCHIDRNNTLGREANTSIHSVGGLDFTGQNCVFRRVTFNDNFGRGFRSDYGLEDVLFEQCEVARNNSQGGVFHEIEFGPVVWRNSRIVDNTGKQGLGLLAVNRVTLDRCTISGNEGTQIQFYVSPKRYRQAEMLPLGWMKTNDPQKGYDHVGIAEDAFMPRGYIREFTLKNSIVAATGQNQLIGRFFPVGDAKEYGRLIRSDEFTASGNTYWNPDRVDVFENFEDNSEYNKQTFVDFAKWKSLTGKDADSLWRKP